MESDSKSGAPVEPAKSLGLADIVGTTIALLTLTLPLWAIAYYSSQNLPNLESLPTTSYPLNQVKE